MTMLSLEKLEKMEKQRKAILNAPDPDAFGRGQFYTADNNLNREFAVSTLDTSWVTDITYIRT